MLSDTAYTRLGGQPQVTSDAADRGEHGGMLLHGLAWGCCSCRSLQACLVGWGRGLLGCWVSTKGCRQLHRMFAGLV